MTAFLELELETPSALVNDTMKELSFPSLRRISTPTSGVRRDMYTKGFKPGPGEK